MKKKTVAEWYQVSKKAAGIEGGWNNSDLELNAEVSENSDSHPYPEAMPFSAISKHLTIQVQRTKCSPASLEKSSSLNSVLDFCIVIRSSNCLTRQRTDAVSYACYIWDR